MRENLARHEEKKAIDIEVLTSFLMADCILIEIIILVILIILGRTATILVTSLISVIKNRSF